jgi:transcriptional regulator with XRE-family HTH domain
MRNKLGVMPCPSCQGTGKIEITDKRKALGYKIAIARERKKMRQEDLASALGMTRTSITNIEAGRQNLPVDKIYSIAEVLKVDPRDLV